MEQLQNEIRDLEIDLRDAQIVLNNAEQAKTEIEFTLRNKRLELEKLQILG